MPKLPTFSAGGGDAPAFGGRRAEAGDFDRTGAGLVQAGRQIQGAATELMSEFEQQEARKALVGSTEIRARYNRRLDEAAINGEDIDKIKQEMLDELSKIGSDFQTKRGADSLQVYTANNEITFDQEAVRIKAVRAGAEAKLLGHKFLNDAGANIQRDPSRLKQEEAAADALAATFANLPKEQRALIADGLKKDLNMAAAVASARDDPAGTKKKLEAGEWDLSPEQRSTAINKAETEERARRADAAYQRAEKEREKQEQNDAARDAHFASIMKGTASQRQIMDDPRLTPATREHMIALMEARAKAGAAAEKRSDPAVKKELWMKINAPEGDPSKMYSADAIFAAVQSGKINTTDADYLNNQMAAQRDVNGSRFGQRLNQRMSVIGRAMNDSPEFKAQPELAAAIQNSLIAQVEQKSAEMRKANKSPDDLLNPDSADYFFKPGLLKATAAAIKQQAVDEARRGATRVRSAEEALAVPDGTVFVDDSGTPKQMTPALRKRLEKVAKTPTGPKFPITLSGETDFARKAREAEDRSRRYRAWLRGE